MPDAFSLTRKYKLIIHPKVRGFICTTTHPTGCERNVLEQIEATRAQGVRTDGPKKVLVIGASSGYGLAARVTAAFGFKADTLGVFFEKPGTATKAGTAGWYNSAAFDKFAKADGLYSKSINGDAFSDEARAKVIELIKSEMGGQVDLVIYSLASPVRKLPGSGEVKRSVLKPIGQTYTSTAIDTNKDTIVQASIEPATEQEIEDTVTVMGGQDWQLWIDALNTAGVLAQGARTVAFSYIGTEITWPIYWHGALGKAKADLDATAQRLNSQLQAVGGGAAVAVLKSVVTQASAAIPVMPLYISMVYKVMKEQKLHEGTIDQLNRLFRDRLYREDGVAGEQDGEGRLRLDDWELRDDVQQACKALWPKVTSDNLFELTDYAGYKHEFLKLFGFERTDVDYDADVATDVTFDCIEL
ncbi:MULTISPECIES: enoyl-ACP reductase FabV [unclassified Pseudomonas]|uniref:enoyl-ACP reductase FabV n=1 Tax=unclassified Pseudomonas TaxID=196821 RepID=UPI000BC6FAC4|nr:MULTISPECIES: enoyl-ACP reductase FabV [unclassified Pseudomonas]PVZ13779.1 enoyl-[acyl-carrier protein] reductase/trans-2-enoyl-CoA reductase (NAD+) [Pseudomonas sp. URIL14HWK12:I12]PVZ24085.1 enoyl-[acyl-carrier protein] reductase/trans-2-enoyl-CoA reductase (NAD+) [Pseudomonas sp. URIL14HWK12:I10]PVZ33276.1 enoyl-[acyl-carrier protein] reductase/trans-2-enoyl-CoA reductase (NAD+) [Pseudomonas sp. URIL14HWK12:I11]SNZ10970.1 enoyl-[acyl-carrier protein] reductase / trans-2-enoyl-CoA reducta